MAGGHGLGPAPDSDRLALLCRARTRVCALLLSDVVETMRPLPVTGVPSTLPFVLGLSVIRGAPVPVIDLGALLGDLPSGEATRFVVLRLGERRVALAVEQVLGLRGLPARQFGDLPPLLKEAAEAVSSVAALDGELALVLGSARLVPDSVWMAAETGRGG